MNSVYLDYAATAPIESEVIDAMTDCWRRIQGNPASQHRSGRQAKTWLEDASEAICLQLGARMIQPNADRFVLTSGGTEANNLALLGWIAPPAAQRMIVSSIEHPSVIESARELERRGWQIDWLHALADGQIDLCHLRWLLEKPDDRQVSLVSVMYANNETGVSQPITEVVEQCTARGIPVHTDAVQAIGKVPINFQDLGVTLMTVAAHKFNGPCGAGGLLVRGRTPVQPILRGGEQQLGVRPGTESVPLVVGMQTALHRWCAQMPERAAYLATCRDRLERRLTGSASRKGDVDPELGGVVNGGAPRLPQTVNISFPRIDRQALLMALDLAGVCCSTGSACASGSSEPSHVLRAMGLSSERIEGAIRLSVGIQNQPAEIDLAADRIIAAVKQLQA